MNTIHTDYLKDDFESLLSAQPDSALNGWRKEGFDNFTKLGLPTLKNEFWKYTGVARLFVKDYGVPGGECTIDESIIKKAAIPGSEDFNQLVIINGKYIPQYSNIQETEGIEICSLDEAAKGKYHDVVQEYFGKSGLFLKDGIYALNTSFFDGAVFILIKKNHTISNPVYFNHIFDTTQNHLLASPRSLVIVEENANVSLIESYCTNGSMDSLSNEVMEVVAKDNSHVEVYRIQNDQPTGSHVGTTHIRQVGKCFVNTVVVSMDGGMIRNNTNVIMEKEGNEAHLYGLYFLKGHTHVDNHTLVDNSKPRGLSNELYKGIMDEYSTGIFSGRILVRPDAQKIDAYQTNNNILISDKATVNTKPQLEIYADDVKCSHGCTVGRLDEEALYYLRTRGIDKDLAQAMLLKAFAEDIVNHIKVASVKDYVNKLIATRLNMED